jgi:hypothetical protein
MPIVGNKKVFAIEWEIISHYKAVPWTSVNFRYWGNSTPIGVWEDYSKLEEITSLAEEFLNSNRIWKQYDFSNFEKGEVFRCLYNSGWKAEINDEFDDFYTFCRTTMIQWHEQRNLSLKNKDKFKVEQYLQEYPYMNQDFSLSSWIRLNFYIDHLGAENFHTYLLIFLVRDIRKNRERLIWNYFENNEIFELILPIGHFEQIAKEFLIQVNLDVEKFKIDLQDQSKNVEFQ